MPAHLLHFCKLPSRNIGLLYPLHQGSGGSQAGSAWQEAAIDRTQEGRRRKWPEPPSLSLLWKSAQLVCTFQPCCKIVILKAALICFVILFPSMRQKGVKAKIAPPEGEGQLHFYIHIHIRIYTYTYTYMYILYTYTFLLVTGCCLRIRPRERRR